MDVSSRFRGKSKSGSRSSLNVTPVPSLSPESQESIDSMDEAEQLEIDRRKAERDEQIRHQKEMAAIQATQQAMQRSLTGQDNIIADELGDLPGGMFRESSNARWNEEQIARKKQEMLQALAEAVHYSNTVSAPPSAVKQNVAAPVVPMSPVVLPANQKARILHVNKTSKLVDDILTDMDVQTDG